MARTVQESNEDEKEDLFFSDILNSFLPFYPQHPIGNEKKGREWEEKEERRRLIEKK